MLTKTLDSSTVPLAAKRGSRADSPLDQPWSRMDRIAMESSRSSFREPSLLLPGYAPSSVKQGPQIHRPGGRACLQYLQACRRWLLCWGQVCRYRKTIFFLVRPYEQVVRSVERTSTYLYRAVRLRPSMECGCDPVIEASCRSLLVYKDGTQVAGMILTTTVSTLNNVQAPFVDMDRSDLQQQCITVVALA